MRSVAIGMLGSGVVGTGVAEAIEQRADKLAASAGVRFELKRVLVRDVSKPRGRHPDPSLLTDDPAQVVAGPDIDLVIEVMGGLDPAEELVSRALAAGKHVVTANKELIAHKGPALHKIAEQNRVGLLYEASVGGGIPLITPLRDSLISNRVTRIRGIINGTTNYILTKMAKEGWDFDAALGEAQRLGFAEADPTNDIEGIDAGFKLAILATLAFGQFISPESIRRKGIGELSPRDFRYAKELGYAIKLLAIGRQFDGTYEAVVEPAFVPVDQLLASVDGVFNAVELECDLVGDVVFYGAGAGAAPTASAIMGDVVALATGKGISLPRAETAGRLRQSTADELWTRYYLRLNVPDRPGVLAQFGRIFADNEISIASIIQQKVDDMVGTAEVVIMTHSARESSMRHALDSFTAVGGDLEVGSAIRVEG